MGDFSPWYHTRSCLKVIENKNLLTIDMFFLFDIPIKNDFLRDSINWD